MKSTPWKLRLLFAMASIVAIAIPLAYLNLVVREPSLFTTDTPAADVTQYQAGQSTQHFDHGGVRRSYILYTPQGITGERRYPLVMVFHGAGADAETMIPMTRFNEIADQHKAVIAYMNGTTDEQRGESEPVEGQQYHGRVWHSGRSFTERVNTVDDVGFVEAAIDHVALRRPIDQSRIFAAGFSNGGSLAYRLACESDRFTAVAAVGSALETPACLGVKPTSLLSVYADNDATYDPSFVTGPLEPKQSVAGSNRQLADAFGCRDDISNSYGPYQTSGNGECRGGVTVEAIKLNGVGHTWTDDTTETIWAFFAAH